MSSEKIKHLIVEREESKLDSHRKDRLFGNGREMSCCEGVKLSISRKERARPKKNNCPV